MSRQRRRAEYPFAKKWVAWSVVMALGAIAMALFVLTELIWLLSYFAFTFLLTIALFAVKFYIYSSRESGNSDSSHEGGEKPQKHGFRWSVVGLLSVSIVALFFPALLSMVLEPVFLYIGLSGFIAGTSLSEVALFLYFRR